MSTAAPVAAPPPSGTNQAYSTGKPPGANQPSADGGLPKIVIALLGSLCPCILIATLGYTVGKGVVSDYGEKFSPTLHNLKA